MPGTVFYNLGLYRSEDEDAKRDVPGFSSETECVVKAFLGEFLKTGLVAHAQLPKLLLQTQLSQHGSYLLLPPRLHPPASDLSEACGKDSQDQSVLVFY